MINGIFELSPDCPRMLYGDASDKNALTMVQQAGGDSYNLFRGFAGAENDFRKSAAERPMSIDPCKPEVSHRGVLKSSQDLVAADASGAKLLEQPDGFRRGHAPPPCHKFTMGSR
jgi:hypothetical protein